MSVEHEGVLKLCKRFPSTHIQIKVFQILSPPSSISRFCTEEGAPVLKPTGSRDSNTVIRQIIPFQLPENSSN